MSFSNLISSALEQATSHSSGGSGSGSYDPEFSSAQHHAQAHESSGDSSLFSSALGFLSDRKSQYSEQPDIDEEHLVQSHQQLYNGGGGGYGEEQQHDSKSLGAGAAMQALKMFTSGGGGSSGGDKNEFIGMAMAQASKLWEEKSGSGNVVSVDYMFPLGRCWGKGCGLTGGWLGSLAISSLLLTRRRRWRLRCI